MAVCYCSYCSVCFALPIPDSVHKDNFEKIRIFSKFETVIKNLEYYHEYTLRKGTIFTVKICPMRQNWNEIPDIINFLNNKNIPFLFNNVIIPAYTSLWNLSSEELKIIADHIEKPIYKGDSVICKTNNDRVKNLISQIRNWQITSAERENKYPDLKFKTPLELLQLIITSILDFLSSNPDMYDKIEYGNKMKNIFNEIFEKISDEEILKNALVFYFEMPVHRLINEFNIRNIEKIINLTKQIGLTEPAPIK
jgi:hypothetical protein